MSKDEALVLTRTDALIVVDAQPTFMPGGGLPVPDGQLIVPVIKRLHGLFPKARRYATLDCHPLGHISLASSYVGLEPGTALTLAEVRQWGSDAASHLDPRALFSPEQLLYYLSRVKQQVLWPDHALDGTDEAMLHPELPPDAYRHIQIKGTDPLCDSYSGFRDNLRRPTGLAERLRRDGVRRLFLVGLALDFCVGFTAVDAVLDRVGEAYVIEDATRSVGLGDSVEKMHEMFASFGVRLIRLTDIVGVPG